MTDVARRVFQPLTHGPSPALRERGVLQRMLYQFGVNLCTMLPPAILQRVKRGNEIGARQANRAQNRQLPVPTVFYN